MGMNFYLDEELTQHFGKRSGAGFYCFDCNLSLCKDGSSHVHESNSNWYKACPKCKKFPQTENFNNSSMGLELGFNTEGYVKKTGVRSCSSWTWAIDPYDYKIPEFIYDELGRKIEYSEFLKMLQFQCPIQFMHLIDQEFS